MNQISGFVVELQKNCWLAGWEGDPGRTIVVKNARIFKTEKSAVKALEAARVYREFPEARIAFINI